MKKVFIRWTTKENRTNHNA